MSSRNRTFVLQAVGVAVVVGVIFFAFLRASDQDDLAGIDAPGSEGPTLAIPGDNREPGPGDNRALGNDREDRPKSGRGEWNRPDSGRKRAVRSGLGVPGGGPPAPPTENGPTDDQYTDTATALMDQVRAAPSGFER